MALKPARLWICSWVFRFIPHSRAHELKATLLRWAGARIGNGCSIMSSVRILGAFNLEIGDGCFIGHEALLFGASGSAIRLADHSKVGSRAILVTGSHRFSTDGDCIEKEGVFGNVTLGRGSVVSTGSTVLPGVTVESMAHVAPGAVVAKDVPAFHRVGGVPARVIRDLRLDPGAQ